MQDTEREDRIAMEIVVDAHDASERAMGWFSYLEDAMTFPSFARCARARAISPLKVGDEVEMVDIGPENECSSEMFVLVRWGDGQLAVPLSQLDVDERVDEATGQAVNDWLYWVERGYAF